MVTWGKYLKINKRYVMPLSMQISHAVADGYHCAEFYSIVNELIREYQ